MALSANPTNSDSTLLELLGLIKRIEHTIVIHEAAENPDKLAIEQYDSLRNRYTSELLELLKQEYGLKLRPILYNDEQAA